MTGAVCKCVCSSLLVAVVGIAAVVAAPSVDSSSVSTKADNDVQQRPDLLGSADWMSIHDSTICPAQVAFNRELRVLEVWCAEGVEGQTFSARGELFVCKSLRYTIQHGDVDVDVLGGCVARLEETTTEATAKDV